MEKHDINEVMHEKPQPSAYNQENDFCLTTRSDLILKPLTTNLSFILGRIYAYRFLSSSTNTILAPCMIRCRKK